IWQQVEFGSYAADLPVWRELAAAADGPVLELGAGAGRVALHLAEQGTNVIAVERDAGLAAQLEASATERGVPVTMVVADLGAPGELFPPGSPGLAIGPLHLIQILDGGSRPALLRRLAEVVAPGGRIALTVVDESTLLSAGTAARQILPDMREIDGWVYSSEPLWVQVGDDALTVRRLRERVSPDGRMERTVRDEVLHRVSPDRLELEAEEAHLRPTGRRQISSGPNEADSTVVLLEVRP
ncbi:MAG TPA: class I SAM-dependent methyltransferase, partial [Solirubrobacterales bacterium]|nr:class I SAM-dependent methyltransferase [Solirubrobacterales bacterium]